MDQSTENTRYSITKVSRLVEKALQRTMSRRSFSDKKTKRKGSIMKTAILILLMGLSTGCAMNPYRMANYFPESQTPQHTGSTLKSPSASTIVTTQGNYVVIPNYSSGSVQAIITPGR